jgi:anti-repressor protein
MKTQDFKYSDAVTLRVLPIVENESNWFVAKDICGVLGIVDTSQAIGKLDDDEKLMRKLYVSGQDRETWTVNESGLYSLILTSNKPEAKAFKRWITHDVIPSIRRAGKYTNEHIKQREQTIHHLITSIEAKLKNAKEHTTLANKDKTSAKAMQSELNILLKSDSYQVRLDM